MQSRTHQGRYDASAFLIIALLAVTAHAQDRGATASGSDAPAANAANLDTTNPDTEVVVTGTRRTGLEASDSPAPIQVLDSTLLARVGQPDLIQSLAQNVPSFTAQAFGDDTANLTLSAKLRGLSPNHSLVLINGKRRHTTSNLAVLDGPYQGGAAADLSFIPVAAIERIEILQDGAAAQYGSDAIAGVVNIILRDAPSGGSLLTSAGSYIDGGGDTLNVAANFGFEPGVADAFFNFTGEARTHDRSNRGGIDPRVVDPANLAAMPSLLEAPGYPYVNQILGDAQYKLYIASFNTGFSLSDSTEVYGFGTYGIKRAEAYENYRMPNRVPSIYPNGFSPKEQIRERDSSITAGIKGLALDAWSWDLSSSYGKDDIEVNTVDSANVSLFLDTGTTPTDFHAGDFIASQWTTTIDVNRDFELGLPDPLNFAFGLEYRKETYQIKPGDPASRYKEGSQSFPGFALTDAGKHDRDNKAVYVDFALSPIDKLQLDIAGRYERFSDFGDASVGKLTSRYDFTDAFAVRGTFSTGFRAPTLAEEFYSATNVTPSSAFVQLPPNSQAATLVGINGLQPEESTNYSFGVVTRPAPRLTATLDVYQIDVDDRVVGSGALFGRGGSLNAPAVIDAITANGNVLDPAVTQIGINIFSNGLDTRTRGADLVMSYFTEHAWGRLNFSLAASYNETEVTQIKAPPPQLNPLALFDLTAISDLETTAPRHRSVLGVLWSYDRYSVNLRESIYGKASRLETFDGGTYYETETGVTPITDLELSYETSGMKLTLGANNLFNEYPRGRNEDLLTTFRNNLDTEAVDIYPAFSPFGINGGYYYGKMTFTF